MILIKNNINKYLRRSSRIASQMLLMGLFLVFMSCSSEDVLGPGSEEKEKPVCHIELKVTLPSGGTRSTTTDQGESSEVPPRIEGTARETALYSAMLYFCDEDYNILLPLEINGIADSTDGSNYILTKEVELDELKVLSGKEIYLFVVGNYSFSPVHNFRGSITAEDAKISIGNIDAIPVGDFMADDSDGRLMTFVNEHEFVVDFTDLPDSGGDEVILEALESLFSNSPKRTVLLKDEKNNRTSLNLERAVARIDWKDMPREIGVGIDNKFLPANTYHLSDTEIKLKTYSLQVFNVNRESYLFRHTAEGSKIAADYSNLKLFGKENNHSNGDFYNWFAGCDWNVGPTKNVSFLSNLISTKPYRINYSTGYDGLIKISSLETRTKHDGYYPWRYVTENTIPSSALMSEENLLKYATGIAFSFQILGADGVTPLSPNDFNNTVPQGITKASTFADDKAIEITLSDLTWTRVEWDSKEGAYLLTYYAFIKHNDANDTVINGETIDDEVTTLPAPMKYGVVRNNIYQLYVTKINTLPFPENPKSMFLELTVQVKQWQKRQNDFEF